MADNTYDLLEMTTGILANFVSHNRIGPEELPGLVSAIHGSLSRLGEAPQEPEVESPAKLTPAVIRKLITPTGITSLIDGRQFKSLKRHVGLHGYTPESYREHFSLPADFPMVHPEYAARRSELAKSMGLGVARRKSASPAKAARKPRAVKA